MSYIAFDLDALNVVESVAKAAGSTNADAVAHGLLKLWAWCFREGTDRVSDLHLSGFFGRGTGPALQAFGFVESLDGETWRVRGADRYLKVREAQRLGGKKGRDGQKARVDPRSTPGSTPGSTRSRPGVVGAENAPVGVETAAAEGLSAEVELGVDPWVDPGVDPGVDPKYTPGSTPALTPSTEHRINNKALAPRAGAPTHAPAPAHAHAPARVQEPPKPPPDPRVLIALARWQRRLTLLVPHGMVDDDTVLGVAADFEPSVFCRGVERHCDEDVQYWAKNPIKYLRLRCGWAQDEAANKPRKSPVKGELYDDVPEYRGHE